MCLHSFSAQFLPDMYLLNNFKNKIASGKIKKLEKIDTLKLPVDKRRDARSVARLLDDEHRFVF